MAGLRVNPQGVARLQDETPSGRQLAIQLGVDAATSSRVLRGQQSPSHKFIAGVIKAFGPHRLLELFDVVDDLVAPPPTKPIPILTSDSREYRPAGKFAGGPR